MVLVVDLPAREASEAINCDGSDVSARGRRTAVGGAAWAEEEEEEDTDGAAAEADDEEDEEVEGAEVERGSGVLVKRPNLRGSWRNNSLCGRVRIEKKIKKKMKK